MRSWKSFWTVGGDLLKAEMKRVTIYGEKRDKRAILEWLERKEIVHVTDAVTDSRFSYGNGDDELHELRKARAAAERALASLNGVKSEDGGMTASLVGRTPLSAVEYERYENRLKNTAAVVERINEIEVETEERTGAIKRYRSEIAELEPWRSLDCDLRDGGTGHAVWFTCVAHGTVTAEEIVQQYGELNDGGVIPYVEVVGAKTEESNIFVICERGRERECTETLQKIGIYRRKSAIEGVPSAEIDKRRRCIGDLMDEIEELARELCSYLSERENIKFSVDFYAKEIEKTAVFNKIAESRKVVAISGFVPEYAAAKLKSEIERGFTSYVEVADADGDAPVLLVNARAAEPVEGVVKTFAMPNRHEIDPTAVMAVFYYVFFGLMLSDFAYGLIIFVGCAVAIAKYRNMEGTLKKTLRMFMYCGASTMFWGVMFGSYFGDAPEVIAQTFFGKTIDIKPLWFEPVTDPMRMLMFSFLLGLVHLATALGVKAYQLLSARRYREFAYECVFWYMLIGGGIGYLFSVPMFCEIAGVNVIDAVWYRYATAVTAVAGAVGILLFSSGDTKIIKRLMRGAYSLYGVTGWLSDILSYSRLLALGLATGVIATVFNKMGSMFGGGVVGTLIFAVVFIVGHTLNIGVNLLGAYVHTNRLQFVEFFGKFYEGGGDAFVPFSSNTKYFKFKEE